MDKRENGKGGEEEDVTGKAHGLEIRGQETQRLFLSRDLTRSQSCRPTNLDKRSEWEDSEIY